jgi:hypothetical protein
LVLGKWRGGEWRLGKVIFLFICVCSIFRRRCGREEKVSKIPPKFTFCFPPNRKNSEGRGEEESTL